MATIAAAWNSLDGTYSLVACVNEGSTDYDDFGNPIDGIDPEGSITLMRLEGFGEFRQCHSVPRIFEHALH